MAIFPFRRNRIEKSSVAGRNEKFEVVALGEKLSQRFFAEEEHLIGVRLVSSEEAASQFDRERRKCIAQLAGQIDLCRGEFLQQTFLERLHFGAEFHELLIGK